MENRVIELEAIRGWAALLVLVHHSLLAFAPTLHGLVDPGGHSLFGTPLFALINGSTAVIVFFVLSGYVLTLAVRRAGTPTRITAVVLRRWPRLAGPVLVTNVAAAGLLLAGL